MIRGFCTVLVLFLVHHSALAAPQAYSEFPYAKVISKKSLTRAIQSVVSEAYGIGFKKLSEHDFFHGHLLFANETDPPFAILFHTQEDDKFDLTTRNWLTSFSGSSWFHRTRNAAPYRYDRYTHPSPYYDPKNTIVNELLDPAKVGTPIVTTGARGYSAIYQVSFYRLECSKTVDRVAGQESNTFEVTLPNRDHHHVCLEFSAWRPH